MKLHCYGVPIKLDRQIVGKICTSDIVQDDRELVLFWNNTQPPRNISGFAAILTPFKNPDWIGASPLIVHSLAELDYLTDGDVVAVNPNGLVRTLYRKNSPHNFLLVTEQCNSYCLMCSQPPRNIDDRGKVWELHKVIDLSDPETKALGMTGGEPTLLRDDFLALVQHSKERLPNTALHILTNGRLFSNRDYAQRLGEISHPDLMLGIPLYSDIDFEHDYVVQALGAFDETVIGLYNLASFDVPIEVRVVIHKQTHTRLPQLAEFITRNFPFVVHIALMGLENFGFARTNFQDLWIDPVNYQPQLCEATEILFLSGMNVSIYNHQLCVLDQNLWKFSRKSISDWKNMYLDVCTDCVVKQQCGGFFQSAITRHSAHIKPFRELTQCHDLPIIGEGTPGETQ